MCSSSYLLISHQTGAIFLTLSDQIMVLTALARFCRNNQKQRKATDRFQLLRMKLVSKTNRSSVADRQLATGSSGYVGSEAVLT